MEPRFYHLEIADCPYPVAFVEYEDGTLFAPRDWQSQQPQTIEDIQDYQWYEINPLDIHNTKKWTPAVILDGYPRVIA